MADIFKNLLGCLFAPLIRLILAITVGAIILIVVFNPAWFGLGALTVQTAPAIVTEIRSRNTLVTAEFTSQVHVEVTNEAWFAFLPAEQLWLQAEGTILAGIDLNQISETDITIDGSEVRVRIPPATIVSQEMHNVQIVTNEGLLPGIQSDMQQQAQEHAYAEIRQAACQYGILAYAEQETHTALTQLLTPMGFQTIRIIQTDPPFGSHDDCTGITIP
ncbi:MAG: DUF4230 domain-containing protein [Chloroflexaceae bacterium]|nr:DUF4230 domain-containing protein [Chloroflexaceae bacterium]